MKEGWICLRCNTVHSPETIKCDCKECTTCKKYMLENNTHMCVPMEKRFIINPAA